MVKNLPAMQETQVRSLGWEDLLEKGILQYSSLENAMDRGPWQATAHGITKIRTRLSDYHFNIFTSVFKVQRLSLGGR